MNLRRKLMLLVGAPVVFVALTVLFSYWTFPYDRLRDYVVYRAAREGMLLEIGELDPSWVTGVDVSNLRLTIPPSGIVRTAKPVVVEADHVHARVSLLSLLAGTVDVTFDAELAGGTVIGEFTQSAATVEGTPPPDAPKPVDIHVQAELTDVDARRVHAIRDKLGIPAGGTISGTVDLTLAHASHDTQGDVDLQWTGASLGDGRAELILSQGATHGLQLERIALGALRVKVEIRSGTARFTQVHAAGRDATLDVTGTIGFRQPLSTSSLDVSIAVKVQDVYKNRTDRTRTMFELMDANPQLRDAMTPGGGLAWHIGGSFSHPATRPAGRH